MNSTLAYLYSLQKFGMKLGLRNIRTLLHSAGDPHRRFVTVHIAGTNGKGSTASMIAAILTAAGYSVGLYTSPHLVRFNERIRINGRMISNADIARYTRQLRPVIVRTRATFFEATTAIAMMYFADRKIDIAVLETGLGGRLDATNVVTPAVSVITSIGLDHTEQLGRTIAAVAGEKAGIIKRGRPVVIGRLPDAAMKVVKRNAHVVDAAVIQADTTALPRGIRLDLTGAFQHRNARIAVAAIRSIGQRVPVPENAIRSGLEQIRRLTGLRARMERFPGSPSIIVDVAHNPDGMRTLVKELTRLPYSSLTVVFGIMKDKDYRSVLRALRRLRASIIITQPKVERTLDLGTLSDAASKIGLAVRSIPEVRAAIDTAIRSTPQNGCVVVCGSHYLAGEALPFITNHSRTALLTKKT